MDNEKAKKRVDIAIAALAAVLLGVLFFMYVWPMLTFQHEGPNTGSKVIEQGDMTDKEVVAMLDAQAEASRITVNIAREFVLSQNGQLYVNMVVDKPNNGWAERLVIKQDGEVIAEAGPLKPGESIAYINAPKAHEGTVQATVCAVEAGGHDFGNPATFDIPIVLAEQ